MLDDKLQILLLNFLLDSWKSLIVSFSNLASNGMVILGMVKDNMPNKKTKRKEYGIVA